MTAQSTSDVATGSDHRDAPVESMTRFRNIARDYQAVCERARADAHRRHAAARDEYQEALRGLYQDYQQRGEQLYKDYTTDVQALQGSGDPDVTRRCEAAYHAFLKSTRQSGGESEAKAREANQRLDTALREVGERYERDTRKAYHDYLQALRETWTRLDVAAVVEAQLAAALTK